MRWASATPSPVPRPRPKTPTPCGTTPQVLPGSFSRESTAAAHVITPSTKFQNQGSQPALGQPLGGTGGDAGSHGGRAQSLRIDAHYRRMARRHRRQRAVRPEDRIRERLARPLPGAEVGSQDDQHQSRRGLEGDPGFLGGRRSELPAVQGDAHEQRQLHGRVGARLRDGGRGRPHSPVGHSGAHRRDFRPRLLRVDERRRLVVGLERRRDVQHRR